MRIVLASASIRRHELLSKMNGIDFEVRPSNAEESMNLELSPSILAMTLAELKAEAVFGSGEIVLGADTLVVLDGKPLGKPADDAEALSVLCSLSGKEHEVITGICLMTDEKTICSFDRSKVCFENFSPIDVLEYVKMGKGLDKAGGYGIQDSEIQRITKRVTGSVNNIIGLPTEHLEKILRENF